MGDNPFLKALNAARPFHSLGRAAIANPLPVPQIVTRLLCLDVRTSLIVLHARSVESINTTDDHALLRPLQCTRTVRGAQVSKLTIAIASHRDSEVFASHCEIASSQRLGDPIAPRSEKFYDIFNPVSRSVLAFSGAFSTFF